MGSTRLPGKVLMELGGPPDARVSCSTAWPPLVGNGVDQIVVATSDQPPPTTPWPRWPRAHGRRGGARTRSATCSIASPTVLDAHPRRHDRAADRRLPAASTRPSWPTRSTSITAIRRRLHLQHPGAHLSPTDSTSRCVRADVLRRRRPRPPTRRARARDAVRVPTPRALRAAGRHPAGPPRRRALDHRHGRGPGRPARGRRSAAEPGRATWTDILSVAGRRRRPAPDDPWLRPLLASDLPALGSLTHPPDRSPALGGSLDPMVDPRTGWPGHRVALGDRPLRPGRRIGLGPRRPAADDPAAPGTSACRADLQVTSLDSSDLEATPPEPRAGDDLDLDHPHHHDPEPR